MTEEEYKRRQAQSIINRAGRKSFRGDYRIYEYFKRDIEKIGLAPILYQKAIRDLAKAIGV